MNGRLNNLNQKLLKNTKQEQASRKKINRDDKNQDVQSNSEKYQLEIKSIREILREEGEKQKQLKKELDYYHRFLPDAKLEWRDLPQQKNLSKTQNPTKIKTNTKELNEIIFNNSKQQKHASGVKEASPKGSRPTQ